jgi:TFIIF-interacting CTD phosphatase-like protein
MIINALEPTGKFQYAFGNEFMSTNLSGHDLSTRNIAHLNRDISRIIVLDYSKNDYDLQPENVITINMFDGEHNDDGLTQASYILRCKYLPSHQYIPRNNIFSIFLEAN